MSKRLLIKARPQDVEIDLEKTAILVIDMQNDFCSRGGMFDLAGFDISKCRKPIEPIRKTLEVARTVGCKVVYIRCVFRPDLSDTGRPFKNSPHWLKQPVKIGTPTPGGGRVLIEGTWNTEYSFQTPLERLIPILYIEQHYIMLNRLSDSSQLPMSLLMPLKRWM